MNDDRLKSLLSDWLEQQSQGRDVQPADLCHDCPELADELHQRIQQVLRQMTTLTQLDTAPYVRGPAANASAVTADLPTARPVGHGVDSLPNVAGYEVLGTLGRGGMGVVYKARHVRLKRLVALKMILAGSYAGADQRSRFVSEAEAVARVQHPNIVQIHEIGEHDGNPYFSLEFCDGGNLAGELNGTPLPRELEPLRQRPDFAKLQDPAARAAGRVVLETKDELRTADAADRELKKSPHRSHTVKLAAGKRYIITLDRAAKADRKFDPFLRLENAKGKELARDDDSGGNLNALLVFVPEQAGEYRIIVTSFDGSVGPYVLRVHEHE